MADDDRVLEVGIYGLGEWRMKVLESGSWLLARVTDTHGLPLGDLVIPLPADSVIIPVDYDHARQ